MSNGLSLGDDDQELRKALAARRPGDDDFDLPEPSRRRDLRQERTDRDANLDANREAAQTAVEVERREGEDQDLQDQLSAAEEDGQGHLVQDASELSLEMGGAGAETDIASATDTAIAAQSDGVDEESEPDEVSAVTPPRAPTPPAPPSPEPPREPDDDPEVEEAGFAQPPVSSVTTPRPARSANVLEQVAGRASSEVMDTLVGRGIDMDSEARSQLKLPRSLVSSLRKMAMSGLQRLYAARDQSLDEIPQFNQSDVVLAFLVAQLGASFAGATDVQQDLVDVFSAGNPGLDAVDRRLEEMQTSQDQISEDVDRIGRLSRDNELMANRFEVALSYLLANAVGDVTVAGVTSESVKLTQNPALAARKQLHRQTAALVKVESTQNGRPL